MKDPVPSICDTLALHTAHACVTAARTIDRRTHNTRKREETIHLIIYYVTDFYSGRYSPHEHINSDEFRLDSLALAATSYVRHYLDFALVASISSKTTV